MQVRINDITISIAKGTILGATTDAIVHETDSGLSVSEEWADAGGTVFVEATTLIGWSDIGSAVIGASGELPVKNVIHAVGSRWGDASARGKLASVTWDILQIAEDNHLQSVTIPPISTGANGYPVENCAKIMLDQIVDFTFESIEYLSEINICVMTEQEEIAFLKSLQV